ncbi:MAG: PAS domain S-box protein [Halobaculum sp.]
MDGYRVDLLLAAPDGTVAVTLTDTLPEESVTRVRAPPDSVADVDCLLIDREWWDRSAVPAEIPTVVIGDGSETATHALSGPADEWLSRATVHDRPGLALDRIAATLAAHPGVDVADDALDRLRATPATRGSAPTARNATPTVTESKRRAESHGTERDHHSETDDAERDRHSETDGAKRERASETTAARVSEDDDRDGGVGGDDRDGGVGGDERETGVYEQVFEGLSDAVTIHDPETGRITDANAAYVALTGAADRERLLAGDVEGFSDRGRGYVAQQGTRLIRRVRATGNRERVEWRVETDDGERWIESTLTPETVDGRDRVLAVHRDITEQKRRQREYEQIFNEVNDSIVVHDPETGAMVDANDAFCELVGYDRDVVLELGTGGLSVESSGFTEERAREIVSRTMENGESGPFEWRVETATGEHRTLEVKTTRAEIGGEPRHLSLMRDVTERRQYEETYREVFDRAAATITLHEPGDPTLLDANRTLCDLLGYSRDELIGRSSEAVTADVAGYDAERVTEFHRRAVENDDPVVVEWPLETRTGETRWIEAELTTTTIEGRRRVISTGREITEAKRREREYEQIFDSVQDAINLMDPETLEIVDANEAYLELLGYDDLDEIRDRGVDGVSLTDEGYTAAASRAVHQRVTRRGEPEIVEWQAETKDGDRRWLEIKVTPAEIRGREVNIAVHRDVTERRRRERAIRALQRASEQMQTAESRASVAEIAVATASDITGFADAACLFHTENGDLRPVAATEGIEAIALPADRYEYEAFQQGSVVEYTPGDAHPSDDLRTAVLMPLGDHGVLVAGTRTAETVDETVLDLTQALADHVTTALTRVERERAVRESERRFRLIADRIDEIIYLAQPDFSELEYVNPAYEEVWQRDVAELYEDATSFVDAIDPRDVGQFREEFEAMMADVRRGEADDKYSFEFRIRQPDGEVRWIEAAGYTVELSAEDARYVGVATDITDRKRREQRLEVFNRVLRHNLRNQLDVIRAHAEELSDSEHASRIVAAADRLASMGEQARAVDRIVARDRRTETVDLGRVVREALADRPSADVTVTTDVAGEVSLRTDREAVETVVAGALDNAVEYADSAVSVTVTRRDGDCVIEIADDGPGIPDSQLDSLHRGSETDLQHSRGLGLWQLRWGIDAVNGELSFDTVDGTTVRLVVPDASDDP